MYVACYKVLKSFAVSDGFDMVPVLHDWFQILVRHTSRDGQYRVQLYYGTFLYRYRWYF